MILLTFKDYLMAEEYVTLEEADKYIQKELDEDWVHLSSEEFFKQKDIEDLKKAEEALDNLKKGKDEVISSEEFWNELKD